MVSLKTPARFAAVKGGGQRGVALPVPRGGLADDVSIHRDYPLEAMDIGAHLLIQRRGGGFTEPIKSFGLRGHRQLVAVDEGGRIR